MGSREPPEVGEEPAPPGLENWQNVVRAQGNTCLSSKLNEATALDRPNMSPLVERPLKYLRLPDQVDRCRPNGVRRQVLYGILIA